MKKMISKFIAKQMKDKMIFGDYILAKRLQPDYPCFSGAVCLSRTLIDKSMVWSRTPQGEYFWLNIYERLF